VLVDDSKGVGDVFMFIYFDCVVSWFVVLVDLDEYVEVV